MDINLYLTNLRAKNEKMNSSRLYGKNVSVDNLPKTTFNRPATNHLDIVLRAQLTLKKTARYFEEKNTITPKLFVQSQIEFSKTIFHEHRNLSFPNEELDDNKILEQEKEAIVNYVTTASAENSPITQGGFLQINNDFYFQQINLEGKENKNTIKQEEIFIDEDSVENETVVEADLSPETQAVRMNEKDDGIQIEEVNENLIHKFEKLNKTPSVNNNHDDVLKNAENVMEMFVEIKDDMSNTRIVLENEVKQLEKIPDTLHCLKETIQNEQEQTPNCENIFRMYFNACFKLKN